MKHFWLIDRSEAPKNNALMKQKNWSRERSFIENFQTNRRKTNDRIWKNILKFKMEEKDEESTSFDGSAYILTFESSEVPLKREASTSIFDKRRLGSDRSTDRIKSFSSPKRGCSKLCTEYRKTSSNRYIWCLSDNLFY